MSVRKKIALLITVAGFLSSLVFSCIILREMVEQPLRIIDSELRAVSWMTCNIVAEKEAAKKEKNRIAPGNLFVDDGRYWFKIYDYAKRSLIYESRLAELINIAEPAVGAGTMISIIVPKNKINLHQDSGDEVTFRMKKYILSIHGKKFAVCAGRPMEKLQEEFWDILITVISGLALSVLVLLLISYFIAGIILKPVRVMNHQIKDITERHLDRRIPVTDKSDEFNTLATTLNQVFERLEHAFMRQKQLLADASHELKTPLTMMRLTLDETRSISSETPSMLKGENLSRLTEQVLRMEWLIKNILELSALEMEGRLKKYPVDINKLLSALIEDYKFLAEPDNIRITSLMPRQFLTMGESGKLARAFSNVLNNAVKYNVKGGKIKVTGSQTGDKLTIEISNTGAGVAEAEIDKVFDQFYRVEPSRSIRHGGTGLGLAIAKRIIQLHNGKIKFKSQPGSWTRVTVILPAHSRLFC